MDKPIFFDEQDALGEDLAVGPDSAEANIENRSKDLFGIGGVAAAGQGVVSINGGNANKIDITAAVIYDSRGRRISFASQTAISLADLTGGNNYVLVSIPNYEDTPVQNPISGSTENSRKKDTYSIQVKTTFTQGDTDTDGNPFVVLALVVKQQPVGPLVIDQSMKRIVTALAVNVVDTDQIVDDAVTAAKQAAYLRPVVWITDPNIHYDSDTLSFAQTTAGVARINGSNYTPTGLPLASSGGTFLVGQISGGNLVLSVVDKTTININALNKANQYVLGYLGDNNNFVNLQASVNGEIVTASEPILLDGYDATRKSLSESLWRRNNESFQSYTVETDDGNGTITDSHLVKVVGTDAVVSAGISYVAGRRLKNGSDIIISTSNTDNWALATAGGTVNLWILRDASSGKRFILETSAAPTNGYKLATVVYAAGAIALSIVDKRIFTPIPEVSMIPEISSSLFIGAGLKFLSSSKIVVEAGIVGFADGTIRRNPASKILDIANTTTDIVGSGDQATGRLDFGTVEGFQWYGIFATADHEGDEFNLVASKIPIRTIQSGSANNYNCNDTSGFFVGQRVRVAAENLLGVGAKWDDSSTAENHFSGMNALTGEQGETITSITPNVKIVTTGPAPSTTITSSAFITPLNKFRPTLSGVTKYRFIGVIGIDSNAKIREFYSSDNGKYLFQPTRDTLGNIPTRCILAPQMSVQGYSGTKDLGIFCPIFSTIAKMHVSLAFRVEGNDSNTDFSTWFKVNSRYGSGTLTDGYQDNALAFLVNSWMPTGYTISLPGPTLTFTGGVPRKGFAQSGVMDVAPYMGTIVWDCWTQMAGSKIWWLVGSVYGFEINIKSEWALQTSGGFVS